MNRAAAWLMLSFLLAFLPACSNPAAVTRPGATAADYERDKRVCDEQAKRASRSPLLRPREAIAAHNRVLLSCMHDRGWEQAAG